MFHTIEFTKETIVDVEVSPKDWLQITYIRKGTRLQAQIKPYILETEGTPVEVADLFFEDGTATRMVPFAFFSLVD